MPPGKHSLGTSFIQKLFWTSFVKQFWSHQFYALNIHTETNGCTRRNLSPDGPDGRFFKRKWLPGTEGTLPSWKNAMMNKTMQADTRLLSSSKLIDSSKRFMFFLIAFSAWQTSGKYSGAHLPDGRRPFAASYGFQTKWPPGQRTPL